MILRSNINLEIIISFKITYFNKLNIEGLLTNYWYACITHLSELSF